MIQINPAAAREIKRLQQSRQKADSLLYLSVKPGGCSGLIYSLDLQDPQTNIEHSIIETNGIGVIVEEKSIPYLKGLKVDYSEDLMGGGFRFNNPNATSTCSCSQSFKPS